MATPFFDRTDSKTGNSHTSYVLGALPRLNRLLERAVAAAKAVEGCGVPTAFRGLYIDQAEVERLLAWMPGAPTLWADNGLEESSWRAQLGDASPLLRVESAFALSSFDLDLVMIALAPELDLRYERLYAFLQDDVTRKRPTVDLALNLLCSSAEGKLARRAHLAPDAPLIRHNLLHLIADPNQVHPPLLAHYLKLDEQVIRLLLRDESLDPRLTSACQMIRPLLKVDELPLGTGKKQALSALVLRSRESRQPLRLYFHGPRGAGKRRTAEALASESGTRLLAVDLARGGDAKGDLEQFLKLVFREAWWHDAIIYFEGLDALQHNERTSQFHCFLDSLARAAGVAILAGELPWTPPGRGPVDLITVPFTMPDFGLRRACWQTHLTSFDIVTDGNALDALASRFRLTPGQIEQAVATARSKAIWREAAQLSGGLDSQFAPLAPPQPDAPELFAAARAQSGHELAKLTRKIEPKYSWQDIILPADPLDQLREICNQAKCRHIVYGEWGFDRKLSLGKGLNVLFAGPPGTGKTMAAEVLAKELELDLYKIDLSQVVSKYIGETEKNLDRIFTAAENANAILFFDEADALFGKRSEVKDSHDRYANIEIGYLLQKMEEYEGVSILATNLRQNLDEAFVRRMNVIVEFPFPDEEHRRRIWEVVFPPEAPLGQDVDLRTLACEVKLAGGNIKNIALAAAFYAAGDGRVISMSHLARAARREYQKLGRTWTGTDWIGSATLSS